MVGLGSNRYSLVIMAKNLKTIGKGVNKEFMVSFCENKMNHHTSSICSAFYENNWSALEERSMDYEADCYVIGAIEIVGKLIKLRLQLQMNPLDRGIIEGTLNNILDVSVKYQEEMIRNLRSGDVSVFHNIHYVIKPVTETEKLKKDWFYNNCFIQ